MVQWLGLSAFTAGAWVQSLVGELRSHKLHGMAKEKKPAGERVRLKIQIIESSRLLVVIEAYGTRNPR